MGGEAELPAFVTFVLDTSKLLLLTLYGYFIDWCYVALQDVSDGRNGVGPRSAVDEPFQYPAAKCVFPSARRPSVCSVNDRRRC